MHTWMTGLGLNPSELIVFAVIHGYTASCGSYKGGMEMLGKWCGVNRQHAYRYLKPLIEKGLVKQIKASGGRNAAAYISTVKPSQYGTDDESQMGRLTAPERDGKPSQYGTHIDNIDIINNTPSIPLKGGSANAGAKSEAPRRKPRRPKNRALNYMTNGATTEAVLRAAGISMGEEFYED